MRNRDKLFTTNMRRHVAWLLPSASCPKIAPFQPDLEPCPSDITARNSDASEKPCCNQAQASQMAFRCVPSVPQQPPTMLSAGIDRRRTSYRDPKSMGSPASSSVSWSNDFLMKGYREPRANASSTGISCKAQLHMGRMCAVDHVVNRCAISCAIHSLDRFTKAHI